MTDEEQKKIILSVDDFWSLLNNRRIVKDGIILEIEK